MEDLIKIIFAILRTLLFFFIIDLIFNSGRSRRYNSQRSQGTRTSYEGDEFGQSAWDDGTSTGYQNNGQYDSSMNSGSSKILEEAYSVFGLSSKASLPEVKKRYRELAKKYHPDHNPGNVVAQAEMTKINNAYETILEHKKN